MQKGEREGQERKEKRETGKPHATPPLDQKKKNTKNNRGYGCWGGGYRYGWYGGGGCYGGCCRCGRKLMSRFLGAGAGEQ